MILIIVIFTLSILGILKLSESRENRKYEDILTTSPNNKHKHMITTLED